MNDITQSSKQEDDEIDLLELIYTILHGKWLILFFTLLSTFLAFIYAFGQPPVYRADAVLQVESKKAAIPGLDDLAALGGETDATVGTEIEIIKSRKNLRKAIEKLNLDIKAEPKRIPLLG
ncbi:MAG TPA: tyrosine-protein kinase, partial [Leucothrix sp.]|nr:tyrosine-protein kinase [Leucothrix sp.]